MSDIEQIFSFPFDSISISNPDRAANSAALAYYFKAFFTDGVFPVLPQLKNMNQLAVRALDIPIMKVQVDTGIALVDGRMYGQPITRTLTIDPADDALPRIDRIVVRKNENLEYRNIEIYVLKGDFSQNPVPPTLTRNNVVSEISLCRINVPARVTEITAENIIDERADISVCGYVTNTLGQVDTSVINERFQAFYDKMVKESDEWMENEKNAIYDWFNNLKEQLSGDIGFNLQNQINELKEQIGGFREFTAEEVDNMFAEVWT